MCLIGKRLVPLWLFFLSVPVWAEQAQDAAAPGKTSVFRCAEGVRVVVQAYTDEASVWFPEAGHRRLPQVFAASGSKYQQGDHLLWSRTGNAFIREGERTYVDCVADYRAAVWEDAKLRGVAFRASGNEPGWYLELNPGLEEILLVTQYGQRRQVAPLPPAEEEPAARRTYYHTELDSGSLQITIEGQRCLDSMSGEQFEARVEVQQGDQRLQGCGRALY